MLVAVLYWPGLSGGWLFDDYPNIVDNKGVQPSTIDLASMTRAALSSPASDLKRPLASLSFALNYYAAGLDPFWMKLTNLIIHLVNGVLIFFLSRQLLRLAPRGREETDNSNLGLVALILSLGWMLLPINLTSVLYVVQRMESLANVFVLLGLLGYVAGRLHMLHSARSSIFSKGFIACLVSIGSATAAGLLAKETAVMLPLYAFLIEWGLFRFRTDMSSVAKRDRRILILYVATLALPCLIGLAWLLPILAQAKAWSTRDFTMGTRLLSEARIVIDYIVWTLWPTPGALSFYHDDFLISTSLTKPWTTWASMLVIVVLVALAIWLRPRKPLAALGIALYLGAQLLTATILPLELIYEHRNYFASFGLLLAVVPLLAQPLARSIADDSLQRPWHGRARLLNVLPIALLGILMAWWAGLTTLTAYSWGEQLRLARELASRGPESPRAQYELGRTYIIYSHYDPASPYTALAYAPLEKAASLPESSILPQQALIFMNSRMHLPLKKEWWESMNIKLKAHIPGVQDESSLISLTQCLRDGQCDFPQDRMTAALQAGLSHPEPSARLLANYGDYAWYVQQDRTLGLQMQERAVAAAPSEPAYRITLARMLIAMDLVEQADAQIEGLAGLNVGGRLDADLAKLRASIPVNGHSPSTEGTRQTGHAE